MVDGKNARHMKTTEEELIHHEGLTERTLAPFPHSTGARAFRGGGGGGLTQTKKNELKKMKTKKKKKKKLTKIIKKKTK
jgi:hypothetical protein